MQLNKIKLNETTEKALRLCARLAELKSEVKDFVGEANVGHDDGFFELRRIASEGVIEATQELIAEEIRRES